MSPPKRVLILVNPSACSGRGPRRLRPLRATLDPSVFQIEWRESRDAAHLRALVAEAHAAQQRPDVLAVAGGDGTVALAAAALRDVSDPLPLLILPVGSGNDFAKELGVPRDPLQALRLVHHGQPRLADLGIVEQADASPAPRFCCVASVGLDEAALRVIHGSRLPRSKLLNIYGALRGLLSYRPRAVQLRWEGGELQGEVMFAAVTNTRSYGGGFQVCPGASVADGALDLCVVRATGRLRLLGKFPRILRGTHGDQPEVLLARSPWFHIAALDGAPLALCLDGELPAHSAPVTLRCLPGALRVLAPPTSGAQR